MPYQRQLIALVLCASMMLAAGCSGAGWGNDGPADPESDSEGDGEVQAQEDTEEESTAGREHRDEPEDTESTDQSASDDDGDSTDESTESTTETTSDSDSNSDSSSDSDSQSDSDSNAESEGGSAEVNVNIHNEDQTTVNTDTTVSVEDDGTGYVRMTCDDFAAQPGAQSYYERFPQEGSHLDPDGDGMACESLPSEPDTDSHYTYALTVQIITEEGHPVENELVEFDRSGYADKPKRYITDEDGKVTFTYKADSTNEYRDYTYTVREQARGTERVEVGNQFERVVVSDDTERETYDLRIGVDSLHSISGVDVTIERWDGATTTKTTNDNGYVTFTVYPGEYTIVSTYHGSEYTTEISVERDTERLLPHG